MMTLREIVERCSKLGIKEKRSITDERAELVFYNKEAEQWNKMFVDILGPPLKPQGVKPTSRDLRLTKDFGGIHDNQVLFKKDFKDVTIMAMFWPWQDNTHITLKIALVKNKNIWRRICRWMT